MMARSLWWLNILTWLWIIWQRRHVSLAGGSICFVPSESKGCLFMFALIALSLQTTGTEQWIFLCCCFLILLSSFHANYLVYRKIIFTQLDLKNSQKSPNDPLLCCLWFILPHLFFFFFFYGWNDCVAFIVHTVSDKSSEEQRGEALEAIYTCNSQQLNGIWNILNVEHCDQRSSRSSSVRGKSSWSTTLNPKGVAM